MNLDDFKQLLSHLDIKAESKKPSEDPYDAKLRRFKDKWLFIATLIAIAIVFSVCIGFLLLKQDSQYTGIGLNGIMGVITGMGQMRPRPPILSSF